MVDNAQQYDVPIIYEVGGQPAVLVPLPLQDATGEVTANTAPMRSWWKQRRFLYGLGVVFMAVSIMIALLGTIIDGFCGVRGCSSASHPVNRVVQIVHFRNTITLTGQNLSLYDPFFDPPDAASREERIMAWLIEDDNLQLTTGAPFSQFHPKQRYALATLWAQFQEDLFRTDVQKHECEWTGVTCTPVDFGQGIGTVQAVTAIKLSKGTGQIGSDMGLLSHLTTVDFSNNALTGTLPATIGAWTNLESLNLQNNDMFGSLPASIGQWTRLRYMNVADNFGFGKELPTSIEQWTSLEALYLNDNNFIGIVPFGLCGAANLTRIIVDCDDMYCLCGNRNLCQCA
jgi:hypothetical protein